MTRVRRMLPAVVMMLPVVWAGCSRPLPPNLDSAFAHWFVSPDDAARDALAAAGVDSARADSLTTLLRASASTGAHQRRLADLHGAAYTLGYQTPPRIDPGSRYPLIIYLHGGLGARRDDKGALAWEMLAPLADSMELFLASPSGNRDAPWWSDAGLYRILQTIRHLSLYYPIDPDRVFLAGVSDGATGCYAAANAIGAPFAGFFAISGFAGLLPRVGVTLYPRNLMQRPIYNVNAGRDRLYPIERVNEVLDQLARAGVSIIRKEYPDQEHGFAYRERETPTLLHYLRTWRRPRDAALSWRPVTGVPNRAPNVMSWAVAGDQPSISGFWRSDTLRLTIRDIDNMRIIAPRRLARGLTAHSARGARGVSPQTRDCALYLDMARYRCFPVVAARPVYTISGG
jgi:acetyl esterase/lipase